MAFDTAQIIQRIVTFMPAFLIALVVHEFAHAWMAYRFGDRTSEYMGRLTLNPVPHLDPLGSIAFPLLMIATSSGIFFGWAKPVPVDTAQFSSYRRGLFWVAFAGPLSNIILGFATAFALVGFKVFIPESFGFYEPLGAMLNSLLYINFALAIFNLLPIPPLDGSNIVMSFLDHDAAQKYQMFAQYSFFLLIFLMFSGAFKILLVPILFLANFSEALAIAVFGFALAS